ncbi:hypothetical protein DRH13_00385 [Candidatus Woesebacteria bacterium]|nr:MAG: hypothetical protein DRH13_00385 [Candidatus Woesebacteria bacterium]
MALEIWTRFFSGKTVTLDSGKTILIPPGKAVLLDKDVKAKPLFDFVGKPTTGAFIIEEDGSISTVDANGKEFQKEGPPKLMRLPGSWNTGAQHQNYD